MTADITIFTRILYIFGLIGVLGTYIFSLIKLIQKNVNAGIIITNIFINIVFSINFPAILIFLF